MNIAGSWKSSQMTLNKQICFKLNIKPVKSEAENPLSVHGSVFQVNEVFTVDTVRVSEGVVITGHHPLFVRS